MNAPTDYQWMHPVRPVGNPIGSWICKCGIGHHSHEHQCAKCGKPYEEIPDTDAA